MARDEIKQSIQDSLEKMKMKNLAAAENLSDTVLLTEYKRLAYPCDCGYVWTSALQTALLEHERIIIPASDEIYWIDATVVIPSNRHIEAVGATVRLVPDCEVLLLRNEHTKDGTYSPIDSSDTDCNISIHGGSWEESRTVRAGYGRSGRYIRFADEKTGERRPFYGVSTCMLFNNLSSLTLTDLTFSHTAGFGVQAGNLKNGVFENITFVSCYADGLHLNGNSENLYIKNIRGVVGDDLVALNMYDWQDSSVTFGPTRNVMCDGLQLYPDGAYKALRIEPGIYTYADGTEVDCGLFNAIIRNVKGINTFKLYFQTPAYKIGESPEKGAVGSANNIFFEHITVDLDSPVDPLPEYLDGDPVRGAFGVFELGSNIGYISVSDIDLTLHREKYPLSYLICVGPKSIRMGDTEIFDPYLSSHIKTLELANIRVNGVKADDYTELVNISAFDDVNGDGNSTGCGTVSEIRFK